MVLEEKVSFTTQEIADEFRSILQQFGCTTRLIRDSLSSKEDRYLGKCTDFKELIIAERKKPDYSEEIQEKLDEMEDMCDELIANLTDVLNKVGEDGIIKPPVAEENEMKEYIAQRIPALSKEHRETLRKVVEDDTGNIEEIEELVDSLINCDKPDTGDAGKRDALDDYVARWRKFLAIIALLISNNYIKEEISDEDSYRLEKEITPADVKITLPKEHFPSPLPAETLEKHNIRSISVYNARRSYDVIVAPSIVTINLDEFEDILYNSESIAEDIYIGALMMSFRYKQSLIKYIKDLVNSGITSTEEVFFKLILYETPLTHWDNENIHLQFNITREYFDDLLLDLKKLGLISVKNKHLRLLK